MRKVVWCAISNAPKVTAHSLAAEACISLHASLKLKANLDSSAKTRQFVNLCLQIKSEMQVAFLTEFYQTVRDKCFEKCITKPSSALSSSEQQCLARCADRYAEVSAGGSCQTAAL